jgi:hypothetical protein
MYRDANAQIAAKDSIRVLVQSGNEVIEAGVRAP